MPGKNVFFFLSSQVLSTLEQQQCDWTRQRLCDPSGPRSVGPAQCKIPVHRPMDLCFNVLGHVGELCQVWVWICLVVPAREEEKSSVSAFIQQQRTMSRYFAPAASPLFLKQFAVALPPLLVNWIWVQNGQADGDEDQGGGRNQKFQG